MGHNRRSRIHDPFGNRTRIQKVPTFHRGKWKSGASGVIRERISIPLAEFVLVSVLDCCRASDRSDASENTIVSGGPPESDSLLFGTWLGFGFASAALDVLA
jgi:hypothetical protein